MSKTKISDVYKQMLEEVTKIFEFTSEVIDDYGDKVDYYKMFVKNTVLHLEDISLGNGVELCKKHFHLTDGIKFKEIWDDKLCDKDTRDVIWKYLHSMVFLICSDELHKYVESEFKDHKKFEDMFSKSKDIEKVLDNLKKFKGEDDELPKTGLEGTAIGNLAKEIMDDIGLSGNIDPSKPPSLGDLGSLMSKTFSTIQNKMSNGEFDEQKMMAEAQSMMGGMNLFGGGDSGFGAGPSEPSSGGVGKQMPRNMSGMPVNKMNVNKRKILRKKKKNNKRK
jgi:hypothetical protein